jgi:hypothetical protein
MVPPAAAGGRCCAGGLHSGDGLPGVLPGGPLSRLARHRPDRGLRVGDVVGAAVVLDDGGGLPPDPPPPRAVRERAELAAEVTGLLMLQGEAAGAPLPGQLPDHLSVGGAEMGVGLQPAGPGLLVLAQHEFGVGGAVGLLARHHRRPIDCGRPGPPPQAKHPPPAGLVVSAGGELLQGLLCLSPAGTRPRQLPAPVPRRLVQQGAEAVAFGPQLGGGQPAQVQAAGGIDRQPLVAGAGQGLRLAGRRSAAPSGTSPCRT